MNFDWSSYLDLARELGGRPEQAAQRTSVSRAYYSAFHAASGSIQVNGVSTNPKFNGHPHKAVWSVYGSSVRSECKKIAVYGFRLRDARVQADYDAARDVCADQVRRSLRDAQSIVEDVALCVPEGFTATRAGRLQSLVRAARRLFVK
jgi:uncharacterized protein (UPF0332 family)